MAQLGAEAQRIHRQYERLQLGSTQRIILQQQARTSFDGMTTQTLTSRSWFHLIECWFETKKMDWYLLGVQLHMSYPFYGHAHVL